MFSVEELKNIIDAVDSWITAKRNARTLAALVLASMVGGDDGKEVFKAATESEDEEVERRKVVAAELTVKLNQMIEQAQQPCPTNH